MAARGERGVSRVLDKLEASVKSGQYYEAHQMYRTLYFRYLGQRKYPDLLTLLYNGSTLLLQYDQQGSGADLAILLIEVLVKSEMQPCPEWIDKIAKLFEKMSPSIPERDTFLTNAVKWSMGESTKGDPLLHKKIAEVYWSQKNFSSAHRHFINANDGVAYATMLIELHVSKGFRSEIDMFITQAVLQCLGLRNIQLANEAFNEYTASHPTIKNDKGPPYLFPLLNFLWFLLRALEQKHVEQFKHLRIYYASHIKRDPNYSEYLDNIGHIWFGIKVPNQEDPKNVITNLFSAFFGDGNVNAAADREQTLSKLAPSPDLD